MSVFFEILPNTEPYTIADQLFNYQKNWNNKEFEAEIETLGIKMNGNIVMWPYCLEVQTVPDSLRDQFKKNRNSKGRLEAKKKSSINQEFLKLVKKYGLIYRQTSDLSFCIGCGYGYVDGYSMIQLGESPQYFIEANHSLSDESLSFLRDHEALKELSEINYQKLRLNYLEMLEKETQNPEGAV